MVLSDSGASRQLNHTNSQIRSRYIITAASRIISGLDVAARLLQRFMTDVWCLHCLSALFCSSVRFTSFLGLSMTAKF